MDAASIRIPTKKGKFNKRLNVDRPGDIKIHRYSFNGIERLGSVNKARNDYSIFYRRRNSNTWQVGSEITFTHIYEGKEFINKGVILNFDPNKLLRYTYWTAFSNTEDKPENYTTITYDLTEMSDKTQLRLTQTNFKSAEWYKALEIGWNQVLEKMKELAEGSN
jgi:hypothetical protein